MTVATAYWVVRPGEGELRREALANVPAAGTCRVQSEYSAVSPGTERLVGLGHVPLHAQATMACRAMHGSFTLPVKYGYCLVGRAVSGALKGERVFTMHPHQDVADVDAQDVLLLPRAVPSARAVLIPNLETAWNAVWDAECVDGEGVVVVGAGIVGLSVAYALSALLNQRPTVVDIDPERRAFAAALPFVADTRAPQDLAPGGHAVAFHTTGRSAGLQTAIDAVGFEGRVLDLSWYGTEPVQLDLGSTFHSQRKRIVASQVGTVARSKRATHSARDRLRAVLHLASDPRLDALLGQAQPFATMPQWMRQVYARQWRGVVPVVRYE